MPLQYDGPALAGGPGAALQLAQVAEAVTTGMLDALAVLSEVCELHVRICACVCVRNMCACVYECKCVLQLHATVDPKQLGLS